jgi:hypothetical protein
MSQYTYQPAPIAQPSNGLGIAGFICSLLGIFTGTILSPVGLILSLIALGRRPRGFAIAGVIIGLLGSCAGLIAVLFFGAIILAALGIGAVALMSLGSTQRLEVFSDMFQSVAAVRKYQTEYNQLPADLSELNLNDELLIDPWGNRYDYHFNDESKLGFDLVSRGPDGNPGTEDDIELSSFKVEIDESDDGDRVRFTLGVFDVNIEGEDDDGVIVVKQAGREVLCIQGDSESGGVVIKQNPDDAANEAAEAAQSAPPASNDSSSD